MATWPIATPPLLNEYSANHEASVLRTEMEQGPARQQAKHDTVITNVRASVFVTPLEYQTVMNWYRGTIKMTQWFDIDLVTMGVVVSHRARIVGSISAVPMGSGYKLSMTLETDEFNT